MILSEDTALQLHVFLAVAATSDGLSLSFPIPVMCPAFSVAFSHPALSELLLILCCPALPSGILSSTSVSGVWNTDDNSQGHDPCVAL